VLPPDWLFVRVFPAGLLEEMISIFVFLDLIYVAIMVDLLLGSIVQRFCA
jgi:hypothetical protein